MLEVFVELVKVRSEVENGCTDPWLLPQGDALRQQGVAKESAMLSQMLDTEHSYTYHCSVWLLKAHYLTSSSAESESALRQLIRSPSPKPSSSSSPSPPRYLDLEGGPEVSARSLIAS